MVLGGLKSRDRINGALRFLEVDRVPVMEQEIASNVASELLGRRASTGGGGIGWREVAEAVYTGEREQLAKRISRDLTELSLKLELDAVRPPLIGTSGAKRKLDDNTYYLEDEDTASWSVLRYQPNTMEYQLVDSSVRREGIAAIERIASHVADKEPDVEEEVFVVVDEVVDAVGEDLAIVGAGGIGIPMDPPWLMAAVMRPQLVSIYLDWQVRYSNELARLYRKHGIDFILGGGDLAGTRGPVYSPSTFKTMILPRLRRVVTHCHELGLPYIFRTDGNIWPIADFLLKESGVDGYGEIDASAGMRLADVRRAFPNLVLWGNIDCAKTLVFGSAEDVRREVARNILDAAPTGGYILGSSNTIHPNVPARNFLAMLRAARDFGKYPIDQDGLATQLRP